MQPLFSLWDFLVIKHFDGLATILTIGGAIYLYLKNKHENKQQIATLILNDIRNADSSIETLKNFFNNSTNRTIPDITILPENNWKKFSYLFSRDFDEDEIRLLNKYFANVERISYLVTQHSNLFIQHVFTRMSALQGANINILASDLSDNEIKQKIVLLDKRFADETISNSPYDPKGYYANLENYLPEVPSLLTDSVGEKLKKLSNPPKLKPNILFFLKRV